VWVRVLETVVFFPSGVGGGLPVPANEYFDESPIVLQPRSAIQHLHKVLVGEPLGRQHEAILARAPLQIPVLVLAGSRGRQGEYELPVGAQSHRPLFPCVGAFETARRTEERASMSVYGRQWFVSTAGASSKPFDPLLIPARSSLDPHIFSYVVKPIWCCVEVDGGFAHGCGALRPLPPPE